VRLEEEARIGEGKEFYVLGADELKALKILNKALKLNVRLLWVCEIMTTTTFLFGCIVGKQRKLGMYIRGLPPGDQGLSCKPEDVALHEYSSIR
jgi:hypothetical protein